MGLIVKFEIIGHKALVTMRIIPTFSAFSLVLSLFAQAPTANDTSLLWRISGSGLAADSYLFGTIHMIPAADYFLPATVIKALNDAEQVAFEIDPRDMENPMMLLQMMGKINMKNGTSLSDLLSEADYTLVKDYFRQTGLPFFMFERMKPMFVATIVGQDMSQLGSGLGNSEGIKSYEMELSKIATAGGKAISGLETMDFQLSLFDSIPYEFQAKMLVEAIQASANGSTEGNDQMAKMIDMYKRQAVAEMATMVVEEGDEEGRFEEMLLTSRNINWIPLMQKMMQKTPAFFAVGAGHLGGEKGVISLLRADGYTVEAVY